MNRIKGKQVIITGASSGIGRACAEQFAAQEANLMLLARRVDRLQELKSLLEKKYSASVAVRGLDVRNREEVRSFAEELKKLSVYPDILINNAGLAAGLDLLHEGSFEDWDRMIDTNVKGLLNVSRCIIPLMVERNSGHIVNLGSISGYQVYRKGSVYNATKFAVRALTEGMNLDLLETNIRVSTVCPGAVRTEFSEIRFDGDREKAELSYKGYTPLSPEDVAQAVLFIVNAPQHVNIQEIIIMPTDQRSVYEWRRQKS